MPFPYKTYELTLGCSNDPKTGKFSLNPFATSGSVTKNY